ncbi:ABC transporter substrate-binding protein [Allonocardiopsis opalescens]|uniref:Iron complex transport system substrate-binding protein n=1 Tax=Allonocardiopsis opalescens TaxID=1144618 RepID=A0A2T0QE04_9ACTN|nr:iron-siderophore ABC transporter substrate-binding protein [Allonocardiopsis opalescens]PRY02167.1 iron complex transport system substrate-binding protein [Allonocardiopsis opalescens]
MYSTQRARRGGSGARRIGLGLAAVTVSVALVSACGGGAEGTDPASVTPGPDGFPRVVEHAMGETVIETAPERVLALDATYVDAALALEATLVGYTTFVAEDEPLPAYFGEAAETYAADARPVGLLTQADPELVEQTDPDLILSARVRDEQGYDQFSAIAPTVYSEETGATWKENLLLAGEALGREEQAQRLVSDFEARAQAIGDAIREQEGGAPTVSIVRFAGDADGVRLYSRNSYIGVILDDLGLPAPEGQAETEDIVTYHSPERILDLDAEHIFVATYADGTGEVEADRERYTSSPLWDQLQGVQHEVDDAYWISGVGVIAANRVLDDIAAEFGVDPAVGGASASPGAGPSGEPSDEASADE